MAAKIVLKCPKSKSDRLRVTEDKTATATVRIDSDVR